MKQTIEKQQSKSVKPRIDFQNRSRNPVSRMIKKKEKRLISVYIGKAFDNIEHPFMIKTPSKLGIEDAISTW